MNRSVLVGLALGAAVLVGVMLRFGGEPTEEALPLKRDRRAVDDRNARSSPTRMNDAARASGQRRSGDSRAVVGESDDTGADRHAPARREQGSDSRRGADTVRSRDARRDSGRVGGLGDGSRRGGGLANDDTNFRAAAEGLPEGDPERSRQADQPDDAADANPEDVAYEPPSTPLVDDTMTYNSGDYRFSIDSPFQIPNTSDTGTVALWVQPEWDVQSTDDAAMMELGDGLFRVYKNVNVLRFEVLSDNPEHSTSLSIADWQPGDWHSISATWENQQVTFYVDGTSVGKPIAGSFTVEGATPVTIGSLAPPEQTSPGTLSDVSLRTRALPADEISRLYNRSAVPKRSP